MSLGKRFHLIRLWLESDVDQWGSYVDLFVSAICTGAGADQV